MRIIIILFIFLFISCYKPTKEEIKLKKDIMEIKIKLQDLIYNKKYKNK